MLDASLEMKLQAVDTLRGTGVYIGYNTVLHTRETRCESQSVCIVVTLLIVCGYIPAISHDARTGIADEFI